MRPSRLAMRPPGPVPALDAGPPAGPVRPVTSLAPAPPAPPPTAVVTQVVRRAPETAAPPMVTGGGNGSPPPATAGSPAEERVLSTSALLDRVDEMMGQLEERILEELERRGGRFTGYF